VHFLQLVLQYFLSHNKAGSTTSAHDGLIATTSLYLGCSVTSLKVKLENLGT